MWFSEKTNFFKETITERVFFVLAIAGFLFSAITGIWIYVNRERSSVKAAQPPFLGTFDFFFRKISCLLYQPFHLGLMVVGSAILYLGIVSWTLYMNPALCVLRTWSLSLGFVILYGYVPVSSFFCNLLVFFLEYIFIESHTIYDLFRTLVARVHRVKSVFVIERFDKIKVITDYGMLKIIGVLILIEFVCNNETFTKKNLRHCLDLNFSKINCFSNQVILVLWTSISPQDVVIESPDPFRPKYNYFNCHWGLVDLVFLIISLAYKVNFKKKKTGRTGRALKRISFFFKESVLWFYFNFFFSLESLFMVYICQ
jgi:hypothetical protein